MNRRFNELIELLLELFDDDALRQWAHLSLGKEMYQALPGTAVGFKKLCFELVSQAEQRGLVNESFFEALIAERAGQTERIRAVAARWVDERRAPPSNAPRAADEHLPQPSALPGEHVPEPAPLPRGSRMHIRRNPQFVGRIHELRALADALEAQGRAAIGQVASVTGLGGIGKTQLAAELVHRYGQFFPGGVFWLSFADPASVPGEIAQCGGPGHLGLWTDETAPDIATQAARVRNAFAGPEPRLLVLDNCEDEALLAEWLPATGGCHVLVTCRRAGFSAHLVAHTVSLDVLPRPDSLALLRSLAPGQSSVAADESMLDAICAELGDLPLALHLAGSFLACYRTTTTPAAYLAELRSTALLGHESLQGDGAGTSPTGHVLHAGKTFALSWERLDPTSELDAMARDLLQRAACLAPGEPIPHALCVAILGKPEDSRDARRQERALRRLLDLGLLDAPEPETCRIHRLVANFARHTGGDHTTARAAVEQALLDEASTPVKTGTTCAGVAEPLGNTAWSRGSVAMLMRGGPA